MSQADIKTLHAVYEAANRGDWDAVLRLMHPDIELKTTLQGTHRGHQEVRGFVEDQVEPFEDMVVQPEELFESGDQIVVFVRQRGRPRGSRAVVENLVGHLWTLRDGKIARWETFPKREEALKAAGLSEQDAHADS